MADREALHVYLSPEAKQRIDDFTAEQGISMSGLVEAIASDDDLLQGSLDDLMERIVRDARRIDVARRRRGGRPAKR